MIPMCLERKKKTQFI